MNRLWGLPVLAFGLLILACSSFSSLPFFGPTHTPTASPTLTPLPPTQTATPSPTPTPTPTPLPAARIASGDEARLQGDYERTVGEFESALQESQDPDIRSAALLGLGRSRSQAGDQEGAISSFLELLATYPDSPQVPYAYFGLGQAYTLLAQPAQAAEAYLNYLVLRSGLVDAYVLNLRGDALQAAGDYLGAISDFRGALQSPGFLNGLQLEIKIARLHALAGDYATAIGMYQLIYTRTGSDSTRAYMDYLIGQSYLALGQVDLAYTAYQDAVNSYPSAYESYLALLELVNAGVPVNELNRGIVDYYARQYGVALAAFDRYMRSSPADPAAALYFNGLTLRALGDYPAAISKWDVLIQNHPEDRYWDDAWEQKAYTQWGFQSDYESALQTLQNFVSSVPNHARAGEFLNDAALVAEQDGRLEQAATLWERVAVEYPGFEGALRALYLAGLAYYRLENYPAALALFQRYLGSAVSLHDRAAAFLWQGKTQSAMGDPAGAQATWELAASTDPTGYYSERSLDLLRQRPPFAAPEIYDLSYDLASERLQAESWMRATFNLPLETDFLTLGPLGEDPRLRRGAELWELGLLEEARAEFEDLRLSFQSDPLNSFRLANYLVDLGMYRSAILAARQVLNLAGMDDAGTLSAPAYFTHVRFGPYYSNLIIPAALQYDIHPLLLFSIVRQESAYEGFVRSSAGARGLMQIMPATGQEIAADLNWPPDYRDEDLYRPYINIPMGASYLARWRDYLGGDLYAALAAYNGGPGNAIEWQKLSNDDPDLLVEVVRYEETRLYIRSIYEIFNIYRRIYDRSQ